MRFVVTGEWTRNHLLRLIVFFFLAYVAIFWLTNALLYFNKMGLTYESVVNYYLGSEERFLQPRSYQGLLEISHFHLFSMGILMLTLTHLLLFVPLAPQRKALLICLSFGSAFLDEASSWLIRFVHPWFAFLKILSFCTLQLTLLILMGYVLSALLKQTPSAYTHDFDSKTT
ncbi:MAG TPA: hypothetical protein VJ646_01860 [Candidatus Binatia bacterium]|nr:hypothetical protein [Candidatus Binatia bacterium]